MAYSTPIAHIGVSLGQNGGTTSPGIDTTGADFIALSVGYYSPSGVIVAGNISDNKSNGNPTALTSYLSDDGEGSTRLFYWQAPTVGSGHTWTLTGVLSSFVSVCVVAVSGSVASPFDQENGAGSASSVTTIQPGSITPTEGNELVLCSYGGDFSGSPLSINGGFTIIDQVATIGGASYASSLAYLIQTSAAAANPAWSGFSAHCASAIASFKDTPGGGGGRIYVVSNLSGLQPSGPFFQDPLG